MGKTRLRGHVGWWVVVLAVSSQAFAAAAAKTTASVRAGATQVRRFEKIEFTLDTNAAADNPYDPAEIDVRVELTGPGGRKVEQPAFHYQPCLREHRAHGGRKADWMYPVGKAVWLARFAPTEAGKWSAAATVTTPAGTAWSEAVSFECTAAAGRGFVRVSKSDGRFLEFGDGTPFFPVGQNVAFIKDSYESSDMIARLAAAGGNFVRVWACCEDWGMAIEARKSGWGRSWDWEPPIVHMPDRAGFHSDDRCLGRSGDAGTTLSFNPTRPVALKAGTKYLLTGQARTSTGAGMLLIAPGSREPIVLKAPKSWAKFRHEFTAGEGQWWLGNLAFRSIAKYTMYVRDLSLTEAGGGPELLGEADVNRPLSGYYNQVDCALLDAVVAAAEKAGVYLQLTLFTRDDYMHLLRRPRSRDYTRALDLGRRLVRYFVARWGYSTNVAAWEYFNEQDPGLPTERFYGELGEYFEQIDVNRHLRVNSTWHSPSKDYKHPSLDSADLHWYMRPATGELFKDAVAGVLAQAALARAAAPAKPTMFSEFGITDDKWMRHGDLDKDTDFLHLHNALWASALSGMSSTVCHWYWDDIHKRDLYHNYRGVAAFVVDIPYTTAKLSPAAATCDQGLRVVGLAGPRHAYLWINDPASTWHKVCVEGVKPGEHKGASLTVPGLAAGTYAVQWWDTREGKVVNKATAKATGGGALRLPVPAFTGDIACKVVPAAGK